jgi:hypothetical protein
VQGAPRGTGIIEIIIAMGLTGVVAGGLFSFFLATSRTFTDQAITARMQQSAAMAMTRIAQDLRRAGTFWSTPCAVEALVSAANGPPGRIEIRLMLNDTTVMTEVPPPPPAGQSQTTAVLRVVSTAGFADGDTAFITDGVQCSQFTVTQIIGGANPALQHHPNDDLNSPGGFGYLYPAGTPVTKLGTSQRIAYGIDRSNPAIPWLTRDTGSGPRRLIPDIESIRFSYVMADGSTVSDPTTITTAAQAANIRMVTVNITARADRRTPGIGGDGFRRHTLASGVRFRNLGQ